MTKTVIIEGMMCQMCVKHVTNALNAIPGVSATVDLETKSAVVTGEVSDEAIRKSVEEAGYQVISIA